MNFDSPTEMRVFLCVHFDTFNEPVKSLYEMIIETI